MTGRKWPSAAVAAFFGCHPLHVESVAWASERKDVLSTFFFLLTLLAYVRYVERAEGRREKGEGKGQSEGQRSTSNVQRPTSNVELAAPFGRSTLDVGRWTLDVKAFWYILALFLFALGLMSKPMVVTLPFVLLLLDFWPLRRVQSLKSKVQSRAIEGEHRPVERPMDEGREPKSEVQSSRFKVQCSKFVFLSLEKLPFFVRAPPGAS